MTHKEMIEQLIKENAKTEKRGRSVLGIRRGSRRIEIMPEDEAERDDVMNIAPEDMKVSGVAGTFEVSCRAELPNEGNRA